MFYEDTFSAIGIGATREVASKSLSMQVTGQPVSATNWIVVCEGSLDGIFFTTLVTHQKSDGDGKIVDLVPPTLTRFTRIRVLTLSLGSSSMIKVSVFGILV